MTYKARLGKRYSNHVGNQFQRVEIVIGGTVECCFDIKVREGRDGMTLRNNEECKVRGVYLFEQMRAGLRHSSYVAA